MKKVIKMAFHIFSIFSLAIAVFVGSMLVKVTDKDSTKEAKGSGLRALLPSLGFGVNHALADVPLGFGGGDVGSSDCEGGGDDGDC